MKKTVLLITLFLGLSSFSFAQNAPSYTIDKAHTQINFAINHFFSEVTGRFDSFSGEFNFDPNNLKGSSANFSIDVNSISTQEPKRDEHLQSPDFFNAEKYPKMTFKSEKIEKKSDNLFIVHGNLTIKDVTKHVMFPLEYKGEMEHPMMKGLQILGLAVETKIDRNDYGVGTGDWAATMVVADEVRIKINMELNRKLK
ncbi:MAG: polyisoprenoid-binding protein [Bacteroidetes bacterium]|nr:polyisoprenoid-binding protein [Bacteroidota bacterium]NCQ10966.1 polyisoprenoid-binding protein [Bacteroidota bacterium]